MLVELSVRNLGVIDDLHLVLGPGMTALTGETGAGKTLVVGAIDLLVGGRADPVAVRPGSAEAEVTGRFAGPEVGAARRRAGLDGNDRDPGDGGDVDGEAGGDRRPDGADDEIVLGRVVPASGRSRAYLDGRMAPAAALAGAGASLVDLHGQHAHQSLLSPAVQRACLDTFAGVDLGPVRAARARLAGIDASLGALGGDAGARAREIDLLRFQVAEIEGAAITGDDEESRLEATEDLLADVTAAREAGAAAYQALAGDGSGAVESLAVAQAALGGRAAFGPLADRLTAAVAEVSDLATEVLHVAETLEDDPARLEEVRARRQLLRTLCRKYGDDLAAVSAFAAGASSRLAELEGYEGRAAALEAERQAALVELAAAEAEVARTRREAAPALAERITAHLADLDLKRARFEVDVAGPGPADDVRFLFAANPGEPSAPLAKVASGGELARVMLAARLVLSTGPPTLVFDEVDAGIGGETAEAVGRALAALATERQVLVVTHLAQVAAFADVQVAVRKEDTSDGRVVSRVRVVDSEERVAELSRMMTGRPASASAREHVRELLASAATARGR